METHVELFIACAFIAILATGQQALIPAAESAGLADLNTTSNILYIIPRNASWSNLLRQAQTVSTNKPQQIAGDTLQATQTVFYLKDFPELNETRPFTALFGSDWVAVPVNADESLFKLIAASMSEPDVPLYPLHLDTRTYRLEITEIHSTWPETELPDSILLKWAAWWRSETNATPVVLILMRF